MRRSFARFALLVALVVPSVAGATPVPLGNADFDADLSGWFASGTAAHDPLDVDGSASSGSVLLTGVSALQQCVAVGPGTARAGVWTFIPSGQSEIGLVDVNLTFFAQAGCAGQPFNTQLFPPLQPVPDAWALLEREREVPAGATSAIFRIGLNNTSGPFVAHFDTASLAVVPEPGTALLQAAGLAMGIARRQRGTTSGAPRARRP